LERAVAYSCVQNYDAAIADLGVYIQTDSASALAYWQRAVCQAMMVEFNVAHGEANKLQAASAMLDFGKAIQLSPKNAYLYFDRGNLHAKQKEYADAIDDYTKALELDPNLAEALYNRGLAYINIHDKAKGIQDLSKAGEQGLYDAYSVIKRYSSDK
jgi:tetratricopeptide (TPR) repeat protein